MYPSPGGLPLDIPTIFGSKHPVHIPNITVVDGRQAGVADDATPTVSRPRKIVVSDDENAVFLGKEEVGEALVCEKTVLLGCKNNQATCPKLGGETSIVFLCSPGYLRK